MNIILMTGSIVVTCALLFYTLGFVREMRRKQVYSGVLVFYTLGVVLDITATVLMIIGSSQGMLTGHGIIGYSSLLGMLIDTTLLWRHNLKQGPDKLVSKGLHFYSRLAYLWWVIAYITGALLVAVRKL